MKPFSIRCKRMQLHVLPPVWRGAILATLVVMMWFVAAPAWAADSEGRRQSLENSETSQEQPKLSQVMVTIKKKSLKHVFTGGSSYAVNKETLIVDTDGKEVKIKKMLVPCDAVVSYLIENGAITAKRIDIKRIASDASWQWSAEEPE